MRMYKCLKSKDYRSGEFCLVPLREEDKLSIRQWRNEQIFHLRQSKLLTIEDQNRYFKGFVSEQFEKEEPDAVLFSFLYEGVCIGYGGLVHISWESKNAEVSFIMNTNAEKKNERMCWIEFMKLLDDVAFNDLDFHKVFAYAYDVRPHLYTYLIESGYHLEARLKQHYCFNNKYFDVVVHSKFKKN